MYPSDLPDMYIQALRLLSPRALICTMPIALSLQAINQYETDHRIHFIDQLVEFNYGTAATSVVTMFVNMNGEVLTVLQKISIKEFYKY